MEFVLDYLTNYLLFICGTIGVLTPLILTIPVIDYLDKNYIKNKPTYLFLCYVAWASCTIVYILVLMFNYFW